MVMTPELLRLFFQVALYLVIIGMAGILWTLTTDCLRVMTINITVIEAPRPRRLVPIPQAIKIERRHCYGH